MLRRSRLNPKRTRPRLNAPWRPQRIRLDAAGMAQLRHEAWERSKGFCEMADCQKCVKWETGELDHIIARGKNGSDTLENVRFVCRNCHRRRHGIVEWSARA
jgi:5-methylcytosine-specific restriction endonuclease McrA